MFDSLQVKIAQQSLTLDTGLVGYNLIVCCSQFGGICIRIDHGNDQDGQVDSHHVVLNLTPEDHEAQSVQGTWH